jgi:predicted Zn-dependent peptidase
MRAKILAVSLDDLQRVTTTYLKDKPYTRASLAPFDKAELMQKMGFQIEKVV